LSAQLPFSETLRLDAELVRLVRGSSAVRLELGRALEALATADGHHELGFSSFEAYARERCERSARWATETRLLAKRLEFLPKTSEALRAGAIGWSTAELLARHVTAESEVAWLEKARAATVRELRALFARDAEGGVTGDEGEAVHSLTVSATREDAWLFECARRAAEAVAGHLSHDALAQSLLAEGYSTLFEFVPECAALFELDELERAADEDARAHAAWCAEREGWRDEAEELCETQGFAVEMDERGGAEPRRELASTPETLDRDVRALCVELTERDLAIGIVAGRARAADIWRRLGFATEGQYASERLGVSVSSLKAKRILALRAARVPELATALSGGRIGYEAAHLLSRIVTPATVNEWLARAEQRTVKHLREEVDAAELLIRSGQPREQRPLDEESLDMIFELERSIVSGEWGRDRDLPAGGVPTSETPCGSQMPAGASQSNGSVRERDGANEMSGGVSSSDGARRERDGASQMSAAVSRKDARVAQRFGRVTLRWNVTETTQRYWRTLERVFHRVSGRVCRERVSFLRFLCENFCRTWLPALRHSRLTESGELPEYYDVYRRDAFRCASPVCTRRDVTPHHLTFRSHGGGDEAENVVSLCVWCHLLGVHEGRIAAEPPASNVHWRIGRNGTLRVEGRRAERG